jgi:hypothetical protein
LIKMPDEPAAAVAVPEPLLAVAEEAEGETATLTREEILKVLK